MKLNKKTINLRLHPYRLAELKKIADNNATNITQALETLIEDYARNNGFSLTNIDKEIINRLEQLNGNTSKR